MYNLMKLSFFTKDLTFPFFIQYGQHDADMFMHTHADFSELVIILNGTALHMVGNEEYTVKKGDVFVINDSTCHGYRKPENFHICNIMFSPSYFIPLQNDIKTSAGFHSLFLIEPLLSQQNGFESHLTLDINNFNMINALIKQLYEEFNSKKTGYKSMIISLLSQIFTQLSRLYNTTNAANHSSAISIASAAAYMENNYQKDLSIEKMAEMANMSSRHFRRMFHDIYHTSPLKYINKLRIEAAAGMLLYSDINITQISSLCGFADSNYFSSCFKKAMGKSPLEYRNKSQ